VRITEITVGDEVTPSFISSRPPRLRVIAIEPRQLYAGGRAQRQCKVEELDYETGEVIPADGLIHSHYTNRWYAPRDLAAFRPKADRYEKQKAEAEVATQASSRLDAAFLAVGIAAGRFSHGLDRISVSLPISQAHRLAEILETVTADVPG
jgi:hypothetical protein